METLNKKSLYIVETKSIITSFDRKVLTRLYQPIISNNSLSLYVSLQSELEFDKTITSYKKSIDSLIKLMGISFDDFIFAKSKLEGIGLIRTLYHQKENYYIFELLSPSSPKDFFDNPLLEKLLLEKVGQEEYDRSKQYFSYSTIKDDDLIDVSTNFNDVYLVKSTNNVIKKNKTVKSKTGLIKLDFDMESFTKRLSDIQISPKCMEEQLTNKLPYLSAAYNVSAIDLADIIARSQLKTGIAKIEDVKKLLLKNYNDNNKKFIVQSKSSLNKTLDATIALYDSNDPFEFLFIKYGTPVSEREEKIIVSMMKVYNLTPNLINPAIDYMMEVCENKFSSGYLDAILANIARQNFETSLDVYNFLHAKQSSNSSKTNKQKQENNNDIGDLLKQSEDFLKNLGGNNNG